VCLFASENLGKTMFICDYFVIMLLSYMRGRYRTVCWHFQVYLIIFSILTYIPGYAYVFGRSYITYLLNIILFLNFLLRSGVMDSH
jgi:hypothetical protein